MNQPGQGDHPHAITNLLKKVSKGNREAFDELLPMVYDELKRVAGSRLSMQRDGHTLNATALVHEAYLKLVDQANVEWNSRAHFFAVASRAMRQILIDYAKWKNADKRGGGAPHVVLDQIEEFFSYEGTGNVLAIDEALERLAEFDERGAEVVQYRFFGGLTHAEIADVLGMSEITVRRSWTMAKTWLRRELRDDPPEAPSPD